MSDYRKSLPQKNLQPCYNKYNIVNYQKGKLYDFRTAATH